MNTIPWVEKYRPKFFKEIVLTNHNSKMLHTIMDENEIPNMLFYGPPGTGKTTTVINLINSYKKKNNIRNNDILIHLNASDERGIEIIRNNILQFVSSSSLFGDHLKFIILDEVDYMTKNAQYALKHIINTPNTNVRFILICNYVSKIEKSLQDKLLKLQFNQLPKDNIISLLDNICKTEHINITNKQIQYIQTMFKSDIRSMINYLQCNHINLPKQVYLNDTYFETMLDIIHTETHHSVLYDYIYEISLSHNIDRNTIMNRFCRYILMQHNKSYNFEYKKLYKYIELIIHNKLYCYETMIAYLFYNTKGSFSSSSSME